MDDPLPDLDKWFLFTRFEKGLLTAALIAAGALILALILL